MHQSEALEVSHLRTKSQSTSPCCPFPPPPQNRLNLNRQGPGRHGSDHVCVHVILGHRLCYLDCAGRGAVVKAGCTAHTGKRVGTADTGAGAVGTAAETLGGSLAALAVRGVEMRRPETQTLTLDSFTFVFFLGGLGLLVSVFLLVDLRLRVSLAAAVGRSTKLEPVTSTTNSPGFGSGGLASTSLAT